MTGPARNGNERMKMTLNRKTMGIEICLIGRNGQWSMVIEMSFLVVKSREKGRNEDRGFIWPNLNPENSEIIAKPTAQHKHCFTSGLNFNENFTRLGKMRHKTKAIELKLIE